MRSCFMIVVFALAAALVPSSAPAQSNEDAWKKAVGYLKKSQNEDGSCGVTGIVVAGLIRCGVKPEDAPVAKGVKFIEGR